ncbi:MAG: ribonuclease HII [Candidatus Magasanikbacteria bacterium CG10_big_fil_rev_8_21_14_0_10_40_10]|nr:MAG: ribonuclease HII [Candidatus Magasanikbacteria bacterium CG10_big_fil_rev_8_21_14_0_10_40_10]
MLNTMRQNASCDRENIVAKNSGARTIAGLDEVGRGAIAGPLVVGCFVRNINTSMPLVADSKLLTQKKRNLLVPKILSSANAWNFGIVDAQDISLHGMAWALNEGFSRALFGLQFIPDIIFYDGTSRAINHPAAYPVVRGDQTHASIAAASIIAKVFRDLWMDAIAEDYPKYLFNLHKGYGTAQHKQALLAEGPIKKIHRTQFVQTFLS